MAKILIAEDSATAVELIKRTLSPLGHQIVVATDGENAERLILDEKPDLLILDIIMPRMDGLELCRKVRAGRRSDLPLIIVTSLGDEHEQAAGLEAGADAYIVKGKFQQQHFLDTIRRLAGEAARP